MITIEKLNEIDFIIRDLRIALDFKQNIDINNDFVLLPFSDGKNISLVLGDSHKSEINKKINELDLLLQKKMTDLKMSKKL